jgi:hypothetical protein
MPRSDIRSPVFGLPRRNRFAIRVASVEPQPLGDVPTRSSITPVLTRGRGFRRLGAAKGNTFAAHAKLEPVIERDARVLHRRGDARGYEVVQVHPIYRGKPH